MPVVKLLRSGSFGVQIMIHNQAMMAKAPSSG